MKSKLLDYILGTAILCLALFSFFRAYSPASLSFQGASTQPTFGATGTTIATSTVNTTSTQVIAAGWTNYARIQNPGTSTVSCTLDNLTAASSTAAANKGVIIGPGGILQNAVASSTVSPTVPSSACFGPYPGCIPYVGALNCVANVATPVTTIKN